MLNRVLWVFRGFCDNMSGTVITVESLSKSYLIGHQRQGGYQTFRESLANGAKDLARRILHPFNSSIHQLNIPTEEFYALRDVSFEINQGDRVGIIGRNGAGKSTLLKILSRITEPTSGRVAIKGRVASLLEVGTGFHPELTGRENIFLNGAILGMRREEIKRKFDEIVAFAEIEKFLDTPVKRYSSGMYVRLAFAVAAYLEPEILIVDEVLAVGDALFQKKCLGKMEEVGREGKTVLFVSHNIAALSTLCTTAIMIKNGRLAEIGDVNDVVGRYIDDGTGQHVMREWTDINSAPGNAYIKLMKAAVSSPTSESDIFYTDSELEFNFVVYNLLPGTNNLDITYHLGDERGNLVFVSSSAQTCIRNFNIGYVDAKCKVPANLLNVGRYTIARLLVVKDRGSVVSEHKDVLVFEIHHRGNRNLGWICEKEGIVRPILQWDYL